MSPELFSPKGVMSFQSDFWAMGCIFYEMARGRPPFESNSFNELVEMIQGTSFEPLVNASVEFNDLVNKLLEKDPTQRLDWGGLRGHAFFSGQDVEASTIPGQPHFDEYVFRLNNPTGGLNIDPNSQLGEHIKKAAGNQTNAMRLSMNILKNQGKDSEY